MFSFRFDLTFITKSWKMKSFHLANIARRIRIIDLEVVGIRV